MLLLPFIVCLVYYVSDKFRPSCQHVTDIAAFAGEVWCKAEQINVVISTTSIKSTFHMHYIMHYPVFVIPEQTMRSRHTTGGEYLAHLTLIPTVWVSRQLMINTHWHPVVYSHVWSWKPRMSIRCMPWATWDSSATGTNAGMGPFNLGQSFIEYAIFQKLCWVGLENRASCWRP